MSDDDISKRVCEYINQLPHGALVTWLDIEQETGLGTATRGEGRAASRRLFTSLCKTLGREIESKRNVGVRFCSDQNAVEFIENGAARVVAKTVIESTRNARIYAKHADGMTAADKTRANRVLSYMGALLLFKSGS